MDTQTGRRHCRTPLVRHELLDAYWFARAFLYRVLVVATEADCAATIGRRLESALRRAIRCIIDAADGTPDKADARLLRARAAIGVALNHFEDLSVEKGVRDEVVEDLREHAARLLERLKMLDGKPAETWSASNCLPTVLAEVSNDVEGGVGVGGVDVVAAVTKLRDAAVRRVPRPVVGKDRVACPPARLDELASSSGSGGKDESVAKPPGS